MNTRFKICAALVLAAGIISVQEIAADPTPAPSAKKQVKHTAKPATKAAPEAVTPAQLQQLRREMEGQINALKSDLADRDAKLRQAQQDAAAAQAAAAQAQQTAATQQQALTDNAAAVSTLSSTVTDLKSNQAQIAVTIQDDQAKVMKAIDSPATLHYKGITITPGGYAAAESVNRTKATGGDIPTAFNALPYEGADAYSLSEFYGSARQSRLSLMAEGKTGFGTLRGYYEADFLGTGTSSNNNQSNSYLLRQRVIWAQADLNNGWAFTGGQLWSLATEDKKGISNLSGDILTPLTIDPNYNAGFVWTRQYGFRVTKSFQHVAFGVAAENPQLLYSATLAGNTPYAVLGGAGANGGNYNAGISACSPSTSIVNFTDATKDGYSTTTDYAVPVYKTVNSCANLANLSFNFAPDFLAKIAFDPGWGHYEVFGIAGFAHETVYPGETTNSNLYGGLKDIKTGNVVAPALTTANSISDLATLTGVGGSLRVPLIPNVLTFGAKGLFGNGVGRYGDSGLSDVTANAFGELVAIRNVSGLFTVEATPSPRLAIYLNYGGDYAGRTDGANSFSSTLGAPKAAQSAAGVWGGTWATPKPGAAVGYGSRALSNQACLTTTNPGFSGSSTGYYPGGSCGAQTRDVQEITGGYWYDLYKGDHGRLRQGLQYSYAVRESWSGAPSTVSLAGPNGLGAKGIDNMFFTSLRYYLP